MPTPGAIILGLLSLVVAMERIAGFKSLVYKDIAHMLVMGLYFAAWVRWADLKESLDAMRATKSPSASWAWINLGGVLCGPTSRVTPAWFFLALAVGLSLVEVTCFFLLPKV